MTRERIVKQDTSMELVYLDPRQLKPNPNNYNQHPDAQILTLAKSMVKVGCNRPVVVDEDNVMLAGHGTAMAAIYNLENGYVFVNDEGNEETFETIPVVVRKGLSKTMKRAYLVGDNELAKLSVSDMEALDQQLTMLETESFDLELVGMADYDLHVLDDEDSPDDLTVEVKEPVYQVVISCGSEQHQMDTLAQLEEKGFNCNVVTK